MNPAILPSTIEWSVASRALPGQAVSGDGHAVLPWRDGVLVAVVDGLGHGKEAAAATQVALVVLGQHPGEAVDVLLQRCHAALRPTRGAALTLAAFHPAEGSVSVLGVGNVETVLCRADPEARPQRESVLLRGGVVGYKLPPIQTDRWRIFAGDVMVLATDGVREDFADEVDPTEPLPRMVERIITEKLRGTDDGLVLACRYHGLAPHP